MTFTTTNTQLLLPLTHQLSNFPDVSLGSAQDNGHFPMVRAGLVGVERHPGLQKSCWDMEKEREIHQATHRTPKQGQEFPENLVQVFTKKIALRILET